MKIACLLDSDFEDSEFEKPYNAYKQAGHQVTIIGLTAGSEVKGKKGNVSTKVEKSIDQVSLDDFGALFIPGGSSPDHLRANQKVVEFTRAFADAGKPIFAICHAPQLLMTAGVVKGRTMTAWTTIQQDLKQVGVNVVDQEVVVDKNLVTSRKPDDIPAFIRESEKLLQQVPAGAR
jgi:protease I